MKSYAGNLSLDLRKYRDEAWDYVARRWPGAELITARDGTPKGVGGVAFYLPDNTVLKITDHRDELSNARRVRKQKPRGVVPVLSVGRHHYIMPRLEECRVADWPAFDGYHEDADPVIRHNIMADPETGEPLYIDLDGLVFDDAEAAA